MGMFDKLKKAKEARKAEKQDHAESSQEIQPEPPQFTFSRTTTHGEEPFTPEPYETQRQQSDLSSHTTSTFDEDEAPSSRFSKLSIKARTRERGQSNASSRSGFSETSNPSRPSYDKRSLSERLHLKKELSSHNVPQLPQIQDSGDKEHAEAQWEQRATLLAKSNQAISDIPDRIGASNPRPNGGIGAAMGLGIAPEARKGVIGNDAGVILTKEHDDTIQEAIRLHEAGSLKEATQMFGRLADPNGQNNALSQVLYGLALRHGWGCEADPAKAMQFLSAAASNAASIEDQALKAGSKKGGAAKGELVLAIFELANSFRHGWGVKKDPVAAKQVGRTSSSIDIALSRSRLISAFTKGSYMAKLRARG
jgi:TPR repeat protein